MTAPAAENLENLLRSCTVRVLGGPAPGAGFFVAPGTVLTCAHVIGDNSSLTVLWEWCGRETQTSAGCQRAGGQGGVPSRTWPATIPTSRCSGWMASMATHAWQSK